MIVSCPNPVYFLSQIHLRSAFFTRSDAGYFAMQTTLERTNFERHCPVGTELRNAGHTHLIRTEIAAKSTRKR